MGTFAGTWNTSGGIVDFNLVGNRASISTETDYYSGLVTGNTLEGAWVRTSEFGQGMGQFKLTLSKDGRSFTGTWERWMGVGSLMSELNGKCLGKKRNSGEAEAGGK